MPSQDLGDIRLPDDIAPPAVPMSPMSLDRTRDAAMILRSSLVLYEPLLIFYPRRETEATLNARPPDVRKRTLVKDQKLADGWPISPDQAQSTANLAAGRAARAGSFAVDLTVEDELAYGPPQGDTEWLGALTHGKGIDQLFQTVPMLSAAIAREQFSGHWIPAQAATVESLAAIGSIKASNKLFERYHPRVLALPFITHGFLSSNGTLPKTAAYELYARAGLAGEAARKAYGVHKEPGHARAMVIGGLAATSGDTVTPVSMFPLVHATWDDPSHPGFEERQQDCNAAEALAPFGLVPDGSVAAFVDHQSRLLQQARGIVERAAQNGSPVCEDYGIDPQQMLDRAMPNRVVSGQLALGASATNGMISHVALLPGLDADVLRAGDAHGIQILAYTLDHMSDFMPALLPQLKRLLLADENDYFHGPELTEMLVSDGRWDLPGLDEISSRALDAIAAGELARDYGVHIDSDEVHYFRVHRARLKDSGPRRLHVNLLARICDRDMVVWSTTQSLTGADKNQPILISELHLGLERGSDISLMYCLDRFFTTFAPHKAQPSSLKTRSYMSVPIMIANQGTVAQIRCQQARRRR